MKVLDEFKIVSTEIVLKKIILVTKKKKKKTCPLNKIPMQLLKENIDCLIKRIITSVNDSFSSIATVVSPILKQSTMKKKILKNYRSVSNNGNLSKTIEKLVYSEIMIILIQTIPWKISSLPKDSAIVPRQPYFG